MLKYIVIFCAYFRLVCPIERTSRNYISNCLICLSSGRPDDLEPYQYSIISTQKKKSQRSIMPLFTLQVHFNCLIIVNWFDIPASIFHLATNELSETHCFHIALYLVLCNVYIWMYCLSSLE